MGSTRSLHADIAGVQLLRLERHADDRGSMTETYRREWVPGGREAVQANLSASRAGVLRGLHWHREQRDHWCLLSGSASVGLVDLRRGSPTRLTTMLLRLDAAEELLAISIPPGVAHGYHAETDVLLQYLVDAYYSGEDEFGLAWDDPDVGLQWGTSDPVLSARDRSNPPLVDALRSAPAY